MDDVLKEILTEIKEIKTSQNHLSERIEMNDRSYKEEFRKLDKKMDSMTDAIAQTMENVTQ